MKSNLKLFDEIKEFEAADKFEKAQELREELLKRAEMAGDHEFVLVCEKLVDEAITIRGVDGAKEIEQFYRRLHSIVAQACGADHPLTAKAKRTLARVFAVQGRWDEAVDLAEGALRVFESRLGEYTQEAVAATWAVLGWSKFIEPEKGKSLVEQIWRRHPICEHLKAVETLLLSRGVREYSRQIQSGNEQVLGVRVSVDAWLDQDSIRLKLGLPECVESTTWEDRSNDGRGFRCIIHNHLIEGHFHQEYNPFQRFPIIT